MTKCHHDGLGHPMSADEQAHWDDNHDDLTAVGAADDFLNALARGEDPSHGSDALAAALLHLRSEIYSTPAPAAPDLDGADLDLNSENDRLASGGVDPEGDYAEAHSARSVVFLDRFKRRGEQRRRGRGGHRQHPIVHGMMGAAAATLVIAGAGAAVYNATPGSPLYPLSEQIFSDRKDIVELAGTLDALDDRVSSGDIDGTRALVEQLRGVLSEAQRLGKNAPAAPAPGDLVTTVTSRVTHTTTVVAPTTEIAPPETVTVTVIPSPTASVSPSPSTQPGTPGSTQPGTGGVTSPEPVPPGQAQQPGH